MKQDFFLTNVFKLTDFPESDAVDLLDDVLRQPAAPNGVSKSANPCPLLAEAPS